MAVGALCCTKAADLATLRERLDDLSRRRVAALERPTVALTAVERRQLRAMRFDLAEVEWHLATRETSARSR
jgi:hypothetical protein